MSDTVDGKNTQREDLFVHCLTKDRFIVINKRNRKVLCIVHKLDGMTLAMPVEWVDGPTAEKWVKEGCIAEIQESLHCLNIGFCKKLTKKRKF